MHIVNLHLVNNIVAGLIVLALYDVLPMPISQMAQYKVGFLSYDWLDGLVIALGVVEWVVSWLVIVSK